MRRSSALRQEVVCMLRNCIPVTGELRAALEIWGILSTVSVTLFNIFPMESPHLKTSDSSSPWLFLPWMGPNYSDQSLQFLPLCFCKHLCQNSLWPLSRSSGFVSFHDISLTKLWAAPGQKLSSLQWLAHSSNSTNIFRLNKWQITASVTYRNSQSPVATYPCNCHSIFTFTCSVMLDYKSHALVSEGALIKCTCRVVYSCSYGK